MPFKCSLQCPDDQLGSLDVRRDAPNVITRGSVLARAKDRFSMRASKGCRARSRPVSLRHSLMISLLWSSVVSAPSTSSAGAGSSDEVGGGDRWINLDNGVLRDGRTKPESLQHDNGDDIDWNDAKPYCDARHDRWTVRDASYGSRVLCVRGPTSLPAVGAEALAIDPSHTAVIFSWNHRGFSHPVAPRENLGHRTIGSV